MGHNHLRVKALILEDVWARATAEELRPCPCRYWNNLLTMSKVRAEAISCGKVMRPTLTGAISRDRLTSAARDIFLHSILVWAVCFSTQPKGAFCQLLPSAQKLRKGFTN